MGVKFRLTFIANIVFSIVYRVPTVGSNIALDDDSGKINQEIVSLEEIIEDISKGGPNENVEKSIPLDSEYWRAYIKSVEKEDHTPIRFGLVQPMDYDSECMKKLLGVSDENESRETVEIDLRNVKSKADTVEIDLKNIKNNDYSAEDGGI